MEIPLPFRLELLPSPDLSVSQFLAYRLPNQLQEALTSTTSFWSNQEVDVPETELLSSLRKFPIPSSALSEALQDPPTHVKSLLYAHLTPSDSAARRYPLWVARYWYEVTHLQRFAKGPWVKAEAWLTSNRNSYRSPDRRYLCESVQRLLLSVPWAGLVQGFSNAEPRVALATYLSNSWLTTTHIDQQLDLLRRHLFRHESTITCEVVGPRFLQRLNDIRVSSPKDYGPTSNRDRHIWTVGEELRSGLRTRLCGVVNVGNDHWVAVAIDTAQRKIFLGDSLGGDGSSYLQESLRWWMEVHVKGTFVFDTLPITRQMDSFSCGIMAVNAVKCFAAPTFSLISANRVSEERLSAFLAVAEDDVNATATVGDSFIPPGYCVTSKMQPAGDEGVFFLRDLVLMPTAAAIPQLAIQPTAPVTPQQPTAILPPLSPWSPPPPPLPTSSTLTVPEKPVPSSSARRSRSEADLRKRDPGSRETLKQQDLFKWVKTGVSAEEAEASRKRRDAYMDEINAGQASEDQEDQGGRAKRRKTELATLRKQEQRKRERERDIASGRRDANGKLKKAKSLHLVSESASQAVNVAEVSRPNRAFKEDIRQERGKVGRPRLHQYKAAILTNWMTPLVWSIINRVAEQCKPAMSPAEIVRELKKRDPILFAKLAPQTLGAWIDRKQDPPAWSIRTLERVEDANRPGGVKTRVGALTNDIQVPYPEVSEEFLRSIEQLREAHVALTCTTIRGLLIAHLQHHIPQIFTTPSPDGTLFRCSEAFVRKLVHRSLGWTIRRSTRAGRKIPPNAEDILSKAFLRVAHVVKHEDILSYLIANSDQTQVTLAQGANLTYAKIGSAQVSTLGSDEKRAITVLVTLTNDGTVLPFQAIYKGSTNASLPKKDAKGMQEAVAAGFLFESSKTSTYWSTQATMRNFVEKILAPHFEAVKVRHGLPSCQKSLWLIDCWSVHRSDEFLTWIAVHHSTIIVLFVPAGLTGLFQPCDVGFQRIFKHSLKLSAHNDVVHEVLDQLKAGKTVSDVKVDTTLAVLRDRTVNWLWTAFKALNKPETVKKAWQMCSAGKFNLSYESLTSHEARQALRELPQTDPEFFAELTQPRTRATVPTLSPEQIEVEDAAPSSDSTPDDDSDVPLTELIAYQAETQVEPASEVPAVEVAEEVYVADESGGLVSTAEAEETLVEAVGAEIIDATPVSSSGRVRRTRRLNVRYHNEWWHDHADEDEDADG
ncbi:hypothetical protein CVT26_004573 [Gymnopilus dilepis]|uniref:Ubiquitin-like protease family profile domain-containing protein n=1 Tax=Gymnopilus dilepis TaxID=231916 RepID=A0A409YJ76_9AGAR|nr:hypothetical protein CVT26_004573 [Gymnopilus dilepis]